MKELVMLMKRECQFFMAILGKLVWFVFVLGIISVFIQQMFMMLITIWCFYLSNLVFSASDTNKSRGVEFLLPVPMEKVVFAKYVFAVLGGLAVTVPVCALMPVGKMLLPGGALVSPTLWLALGIVISLFMPVFLIPINYRFNPSKAKTISFIAYMICFGIGGAFTGAGAVLGSPTMGMTAAVVFMVMLVPVSYIYSIKTVAKNRIEMD